MNICVRTAWSSLRKTSSTDLLFWALVAAFFGMPLGTAVPTVFGLLAALVWLLSGQAGKLRPVFRRTWWLPLAPFILLPWLGLLYGPDAGELGLQYARKTTYWIYTPAVAALAFERAKAEKLAPAFLLGLGANALVAVLQMAGVLPAVTRHAAAPEFRGLGLEYVALSAYLVLGILMASYYFGAAAGRRARLGWALLSLLFFVNLLALRGRNGYFTLLVLSPLAVRNFWKKPRPLMTALACGLLAAAMLLSPVVRDRIAFTFAQIEEHLGAGAPADWGLVHSSTEERLYITRAAVDAFLAHPLIGLGTGGFEPFTAARGYAMAHPHNSFLYMAVSFGLPGILSFVWLFWSILANSWSERGSPLGFFVLAATLVILVSGIFDSQILNVGTGTLLALVLGLEQGFPEKGA